ncbi:hypothetical protein [Nocardia wallacei]|uniref:hypothetical protein n=1 Tax=Nocardia wallacei TaxID=480035 RepID=UPI002457FE8E|nr:hypothetical protein [Nocardia wallacei]
MSGYHQIFMRGSEPDVVRDVETSSGIAIKKVASPSGSVAFGGRSEHAVLEIEIGHDVENDRGIEFEKYPIVVTIRDIDSDKEREASTALSLFRSLQQLRDYPMLLVFDLQELLAEN